MLRKYGRIGGIFGSVNIRGAMQHGGIGGIFGRVNMTGAMQHGGIGGIFSYITHENTDKQGIGNFLAY